MIYEIKPCPYCGADKAQPTREDDRSDKKMSNFFVECQACYSRGPRVIEFTEEFAKASKFAIMLWNNQSGEPHPALGYANSTAQLPPGEKHPTEEKENETLNAN